MLEKDVSHFIRRWIKSVWTLEVLLCLHDKDGEAETSEDLVRLLRSSPLIVNDALAALTSAKLVTQSSRGSYLFRPATPELAELVEKLAEAHREFPVAVVQAIYAQASEIEKFANAFRLRKD